MASANDEVIAAIATGAGRAAVGIVRLSGAPMEPLIEGLVKSPPPPRTAVLTDFLAADGGVIDTGLCLHFPAPCSYTGQDVLELHGHGGVAVTAALLRRCIELGARLAQPGEYTLRALRRGKLDVTQAEGIADIVDATTETGARAAARTMRGELVRRVARADLALRAARAETEALIDFPDDDTGRGASAVADACAELDRLVVDAGQGALVRAGAQVAIVGRPNAGKSSLLNRLAGEDAAIVSGEAGTTRDLVRVDVDFAGMPIRLVDTAGLRDATGDVERIGVERARSAAQEADLVLVLVDAADPGGPPDLPASAPTLEVRNKIDLTGEAPSRTGSSVGVSAKTGEGLDGLREAIAEALGRGAAEPAFSARERHLEALTAAAAAAAEAAARAGEPELAAESLRAAHRALGEICGECTNEDLLGEIFSRFCIGK